MGSPKAMLCRVSVPQRSTEGVVIVARPSDGDVVVLAGAAAPIWRLLEHRTTADEIIDRLGECYPGIPFDERESSVVEAIEALHANGLVERRTA